MPLSIHDNVTLASSSNLGISSSKLSPETDQVLSSAKLCRFFAIGKVKQIFMKMLHNKFWGEIYLENYHLFESFHRLQFILMYLEKSIFCVSQLAQ